MTNNIRCPRCGRSNPDATYCQYCGRSLHSCGVCGAGISKDALFCPECGRPIPRELQRTSWAWWLLPIFLGLVGGIIGWTLNRYGNPDKARQILWLGISWEIIIVVVWIVLSLLIT